MVRRTCSRALVGVMILALGVTGCGSSNSSPPTPTSPTPTPTPMPTPTPTPTPTTASLTGTVSNVGGEGIGGATVTVLDGSDAGTSVGTNSNGEYSFASLTTGNVNFSATASLYQETRVGITVDGTSTLNFTLTRAMVPLGGSVESSTGARIAGATVTVLDGTHAGETAVTNDAGDYRFASLTTGNVNFKATATGYDEDRRGTLVNGTASLNFTLTLVPTLTIAGEIISGGTGTAVQEWRFTVTTNDTFASYNWDFGDGSTATNSRPVEQHVYRTKGTRTVTVTGVRADGTTLESTLEITID